MSNATAVLRARLLWLALSVLLLAACGHTPVTQTLFDAIPGLGGYFILLFALAIGHALADYPLQGPFLAEAKNRHAKPMPLPGNTTSPTGLWIHALTAHSLIQGGAVWLITGSVTLALVEVGLHWLIDFSKCEGWFGYNTDQFLHFLCKVVYAAVITCGWL